MKNMIIQQPKTIRQKVYEHLKKAIFSGDLKPGDRLVESEIGKRIGTSRTPVREALHTLEREKLVAAIPRVGYVVTDISKDEIDDLSEIRLSLETLALRWAFESDADGLSHALKENIEQSEQLLTIGEIKAFVNMDSQFHEIITSYANSERLQELTQNVRQYMTRYQIRSLNDSENIRRSISGHKKIFLAIEKKDLGSALIALNDHIKQGNKDIIHYANIEASE